MDQLTPQEFIDETMLTSLVGCVLIVTIATQVAKMYLPAKIDPKWYTLVFSAITIAIRQLFILGDLSATGVFVAFVNFLICVLSSVGGYEFVVKPIQRKIESGQETKDKNGND